MIEIQNGCDLVLREVVRNTWRYIDAKKTGVITTFFTAPVGVIPRIGDFISEETYVWVARTEYKIVPDLIQPTEDDEYIYRR